MFENSTTKRKSMIMIIYLLHVNERFKWNDDREFQFRHDNNFISITLSFKKTM